MQPLVLIILASVWAAVFIPPLLRSRIENRTSESVSDFRRQLSKLQTAVPNRAGHMSMARPLAPSPLQKPAAPGRPGQPSGRRHRSAGRPQRSPQMAVNERMQVRERGATGRYGRSHAGSGRDAERMAAGRGQGQPRQRFDRPEPGRTPPRGRRRPNTQGRMVDGRRGGQQHRADHGHRQTQVHRDPSRHSAAQRRRSNIMILLILATAASAFIAAQTRANSMIYLFVLSFVALCGYLFMLSQAKQREATAWGSDWMS